MEMNHSKHHDYKDQVLKQPIPLESIWSSTKVEHVSCHRSKNSPNKTNRWKWKKVTKLPPGIWISHMTEKKIHESWVKQPSARHLKHFQVYLLFANPSGPFRGLVRFGFGTHSRSPKSWKDWGAQFFPQFFLWESPNFGGFGPTTVRGRWQLKYFLESLICGGWWSNLTCAYFFRWVGEKPPTRYAQTFNSTENEAYMGDFSWHHGIKFGRSLSYSIQVAKIYTF